MSTQPVAPKPASGAGTLAGILSGLWQTNMIVSLGLQIAGVVIPLAKGLVSSIKQISQGETTVTYQVVVTTDENNLQQVDAISDADLAAINAELTRLGKQSLPVPASAAPPAAGS